MHVSKSRVHKVRTVHFYSIYLINSSRRKKQNIRNIYFRYSLSLLSHFLSPIPTIVFFFCQSFIVSISISEFARDKKLQAQEGYAASSFSYSYFLPYPIFLFALHSPQSNGTLHLQNLLPIHGND